MFQGTENGFSRVKWVSLFPNLLYLDRTLFRQGSLLEFILTVRVQPETLVSFHSLEWERQGNCWDRAGTH